MRELVTPSPEYEVWVDRPTALYGSWYEFFPRSEGPVVGGKPTHGTFANAQDRLPAVAEMGFDVVYLPPIHPIGTVNRKGPNTSQFPGGNPHEIGPGRRRLAVGDRQRRGRPRRRPPAAGHHGGLQGLRRPHPRTGHGGGAGLRAAGRARPPVGRGAPGVVHHQARRHHRLRGEPAEEVPGHLPDQLRQRPRGHLRRVPAGDPGLDRGRRQDLPRRQPAHQAAELLALADLGGQEDRPRRAVPGRGVHPAGDDAPAGPHRVHAVLHVLHVADRARRARGLRPRAGRQRALHAAELLREHPGHPARVAAVRRPADVQDPRGPGLDDEPHLGRLLRLRAVRARGREARQRGVPRQREVLAATARLGRRRGVGPQPRALPAPAQRDPPGAPGAAAAAHAALPRRSTTRTCSASRRPTRGRPTPSSSSSTCPATTPRSGRRRWTCRSSGLDWHERFAVTDEITGANYDWGQFNYLELDPYREPAHVFAVTLPRPVQFPPPVA